MSLNRCAEPGWLRIGRIDSPRRRSLWIRDTRGAQPAIELCAGREGDDAYVKITPENPQWRELQHLLSCAKFAAEFEDPDGLTLAREAGEDVSDSIELRITSMRVPASELVRSFAQHHAWRCTGCLEQLSLAHHDPRLGSGTAPKCDRCGTFMAPVNPDVVPERPA